MDPVTVPLVAIQVAAVAIFGLDLLLLVFVMIFRAVQGLLDDRRAPALQQARQAMLLAAATGDDLANAPDPPLLKGTASNRIYMLASAQLLSSIRGDAHQDLVKYLTRNGYADRAGRELRSRSGLTRAVACELLGSLGSLDHSSELIALIDDRDSDVRHAAIRALGRLHDPHAVDKLLSCLSSKPKSPPIVVSMALFRIGPSAVDGLRTALASPDPTTRGVAARVLGLLNDFGAADDLIQMLSTDAETQPRIEAALALGRLGGARARDPLQQCARSANSPRLRVAAVSALSGIADEGANQMLFDLLADPDPLLARTSANALEHSGPKGRAVLSQAPAGSQRAAYAAEVLAVGDVERNRQTGRFK